MSKTSSAEPPDADGPRACAREAAYATTPRRKPAYRLGLDRLWTGSSVGPTVDGRIGDAAAQSNLGAMYDQGGGVPPDAAEAVAWYRRAAEQGDARAQYNLGGMYREGRGVPPDAAGGPWRAIAALLNRATCARSTTSGACMPRASAYHRMTSRPSCG